MSSTATTIDHADAARSNLDKADLWANRDNVERETRTRMVDYHLRLADVHASLASAQELRNLWELLASSIDGRPFHVVTQ